MVHGGKVLSPLICFIYVLLLFSLESRIVKATPSEDVSDTRSVTWGGLARRFLEILEQPVPFRDEEEELNCKVLIRRKAYALLLSISS